MDSKIDMADFLGKWTLIVGEVNTGKTTHAAKILAALCAAGLSQRIAVIDLAPEISADLAARKRVKGAGGRLAPPPNTEVIYLSTRLEPPRLSSANEEEAAAKAERNAEKIDNLFREYNAFDRDILFVNDISVYVQAGKAERLYGQLKKASTLVANGYYGTKLGGGTLSERERREMGMLIECVSARGRVIWKE